MVLVALLLTPSRSLTDWKLAIEDFPREAVGRHTDHVPDPA